MSSLGACGGKCGSLCGHSSHCPPWSPVNTHQHHSHFDRWGTGYTGSSPSCEFLSSLNQNNEGFGLLAYEVFRHLNLQIRLLASIKMSAFFFQIHHLMRDLGWFEFKHFDLRFCLELDISLFTQYVKVWVRGPSRSAQSVQVWPREANLSQVPLLQDGALSSVSTLYPWRQK